MIQLRSLNLLSCVVVLLSGTAASASDHADPIKVRFFGRPESNLTGLFVFEQKDKLVIALCARPGLASKDVDLHSFSCSINIDFDAEVAISADGRDEDRTFRYGGWVKNPEQISEDIVITFDFDTDSGRNPLATAPLGTPIDITPTISKKPESVGDQLEKKMKSWVGIRDDPFILQGFSTTNVVAMVVELPFEIVGDKPLLIWGTCRQHSKKIDHVGRSLRTMLPRFDFLNSLHPSDHVKAIRRQHESPDIFQDVMSYFASPFFAIRHYDFEPDVLIFSRSRWRNDLKGAGLDINNVDINHKRVAFPNGRRLTDDVALLMRDRGDALLFEVSTAEAHADHVPRPTTNGKPFESRFPYLAAPNEDPKSPEKPSLRTRTIVIFVAGALVAFALLVAFPWWLYWRERRRYRKALARLQAAI